MQLRSLSIRINAAIMLTSAIIALVFGAILFPLERNRRHTQLEQLEILLKAIFQQNQADLANEIFAAQTEALKASLQEMSAVKGIAGIQLFDLEGQPLLDSGSMTFVAMPAAESRQLAQEPTFREIKHAGGSYAVYAAMIEVIGERIGFIRLFYDLLPLDKELFYEKLFFVALLFSTLAVMALFLNLLLTRGVIRPAKMLRQAMQRVQRGRMGEMVTLGNADEIGDMGSAFNKMSAKLQTQHNALTEAIKKKDSYALELEKTNTKLEDINTQLEEIVQERTAELRLSYEKLQREINERRRTDEEKSELEDRLARSQKMEALGLLAGGVAHDLNNVLSGLVSYPDLLLMDLPPASSLRQPILTIKESGQKAAAIVQDLLTLARRGVTSTEVLNLNQDIITAYLDSPEFQKLDSLYPELCFETRMAADLLNIQGSAVHLKKTIMNLVTNAAEAQPQGGTIVIATANHYVDRPIKGYDTIREGDYAVVTVTDRGAGIAPEDLQRIFEPFYTKKVMGRSGTGLGMAVVWGTVQDHRGYINVDSARGAGTAIALYFPVTRQANARERGAIPTSAYMGRGETILVVDDVAAQREIAVHILRKLGYETHSVSGGEAAVAHLKTDPADLLILDMIMDQGIDGFETYRQTLEFNRSQRAIIASGFSENERVRQAQQLGAGAYIKKPYTIEKIGMAVRQELDR